MILNTITNLGITLGYLLCAVAVLPYVSVSRWWIKVSGILFFVTCGITHASMGLGSVVGDHSIVFHSAPMIINHIIQVVAVWVFVAGLYLEFVRDAE